MRIKRLHEAHARLAKMLDYFGDDSRQARIWRAIKRVRARIHLERIDLRPNQRARLKELRAV